MKIDITLFDELLRIDSTSGGERPLADFVVSRMARDFEVRILPGDASPTRPVSVMLVRGTPRVVYCTHLDTVPPYIPPTIETDADGRTVIRGRGACDAKGQIISMYTACRALADAGHTDFALLLLHGEETGSHGAKEYHGNGAPWLVVGEPTDCKMASAAKGTKLYRILVRGKAFHSGYPQMGASAIDSFVRFAHRLSCHRFPEDATLGDTTYNFGMLKSDNPRNILSPQLTCDLYFRTTFATDATLDDTVRALATDNTDLAPLGGDTSDTGLAPLGGDTSDTDLAPLGGDTPDIDLTPLGGDTPNRFDTLPGFDTAPVSFGSDAPHLHGFDHKILFGPGSILVAHRDDEHVYLDQLEAAADRYVDIYHAVSNTNPHITNDPTLPVSDTYIHDK